MSIGLDLDSVSFDEIPDLDNPDASTETPPKTRQRRTRSDAGKPRGSRTGTAGPITKAASSKLADELLDPWAKLAKGLAFTSPTTSAVLIARGEATTTALVRIAEKHPRMLKALQNVGQIGPGSEIAETLVMVAVAMQIDSGRMPANHPIAAAMGVAAIHKEMFGETVATTEDGIEFVVATSPATEGVEFHPVAYGRHQFDPQNPQDPRFSFQAGQSRR